MKQETITNKLLTRNLWSVVFGSLSIRTDGKDLALRQIVLMDPNEQNSLSNQAALTAA